MYSFPSNHISIRSKICRWALLICALGFLSTTVSHGLTFSPWAGDIRRPGDQGAPLGPVLTTSVFLPILLNVASLKKSIHYFHLIHRLTDDRVAYDRYIAINPMPGPGISKPGHHQLAFLQLDIPPPICQA